MEERQAQEGGTILNDNEANEQRDIQRISAMQISRAKSVAGNNPIGSSLYPDVTVCLNMLSFPAS